MALWGAFSVPCIAFASHTYLWEAFSNTVAQPNAEARFIANRQCLRVTKEAELKLKATVEEKKTMRLDAFSVTSKVKEELTENGMTEFTCLVTVKTDVKGVNFTSSISPWLPSPKFCAKTAASFDGMQRGDSASPVASVIQHRSPLTNGEICRVKMMGVRL